MLIRLNQRVLWWLFSAILSLVCAGFLSLVLRYDHENRKIPEESLIGNRPSQLRSLKEKAFPFSFWVMGDIQSSWRAKELIRKALREDRPSFMILLGDFVREPDRWRHRFFLAEMTACIRGSFPVFLVPGNHDIDYRSGKMKGAERRVTPEVYDSIYGARRFDFTFNNCLFIISEIRPGSRLDYLDHLRETLSTKGPGRSHIFLFMHAPPTGLTEGMGIPYPEQETFFSLMETHKVTACFFGDYHGYWRGLKRGVNFIVSGGGGDFKKYQSEWGKVHHLLKVTVDQSIITEEMIVHRERMASGSLKELIYVYLLPMIQDRIWVLYIVVLLLLFWAIFSIFSFVNSLRVAKRGATEGV